MGENDLESVYTSEEYLVQLLGKAVAAGASDVHLKVGMPPGARVNGDLVFFRTDALKPRDTEAIASQLVRDPNVHATVKTTLKEYDVAYSAPGVGRFRAHIYRQRGTLGAVLRVIPFHTPKLDELGVPEVSRTLAEKERGLVLVVGAAGNGKSTTLAGMVAHLNETRALHIVTIEDPIEYLHKDNLSSISQRELGGDTASFADALRAAMRQDPDVILVGEIRDETTMEIALKAAETGHLVISTLHTSDVARTIGRMMSLAKKGDAADDFRERLGDALQGIIAQRLIPRKEGRGLILAAEVLVASGSVREAIKRPEGNPSLRELMEKGVHPYGMQTFEMHMKQLFAAGLIDKEIARTASAF